MHRYGIPRLLTLFAACAVAVACSDDGTGPDGDGEAPAAPSNVSLTATAPLTITVTWTAPSGATGQTVRLATGGSEVDVQQVDGTAS
ncbi:MAG: hypothetical protein GWM92_11830, partial [Gemmatimonadetes bacterium]|nr:hypothetical protein [Gemmatimonadota bacterium]NIR79367.1 hypothetical protein [Gemmatimonadota bacterium]NIT88048.1 hypothetical protein [Gemmatimonadota bacterium]NIU31880.1 hypothetical protein [Gemmatimonadota bacterium]NIU36491.1 hypothetical protein [Gemmatimonadota bacterium]